MGVFDAFFDREAIEKRKQKQQETTSEQEKLAAQHRQNAIAMLTDFSLAWPKAEILEVAPGQFATGVLDELPTANDLKAYKEAQQHKDAITLSGNGWTLTFDGNTVTLRTPNGIAQLSTQQYEEIRVATANVTVTPLDDAYGYANGSQVVTSSNITPGIKSQNEKVMTYHVMSQNERVFASHFPSQNELAGAMSSAQKQAEERRAYATKIAYTTGRWGGSKKDSWGDR